MIRNNKFFVKKYDEDENKITLEEAITSYEEGVKYYNMCEEILKSANQRIETIKK